MIITYSMLDMSIFLFFIPINRTHYLKSIKNPSELEGFNNNIIIGDFNNNIINGSFYNNFIGDMSNNSFFNQFYHNFTEISGNFYTSLKQDGLTEDNYNEWRKMYKRKQILNDIFNM
mgnify:CR=1 FL=1